MGNLALRPIWPAFAAQSNDFGLSERFTICNSRLALVYIGSDAAVYDAGQRRLPGRAGVGGTPDPQDDLR
jgi:hypothetical protein